MNRAIALSPAGGIIVDDPDLQMTSADELKAELDEGGAGDATGRGGCRRRLRARRARPTASPAAATDQNNKTAIGGVAQTLAVPLSTTSSFSQMFQYQADLQNTDDNRLQFAMRLNTQIAGPIGLQVTYLFDRENVVVAGVQNADQDLRLALQYRF